MKRSCRDHHYGRYIPPLPQYVFMAWCLVKHTDNFTFNFTFRGGGILVWYFMNICNIKKCFLSVVLPSTGFCIISQAYTVQGSPWTDNSNPAAQKIFDVIEPKIALLPCKKLTILTITSEGNSIRNLCHFEWVLQLQTLCKFHVSDMCATYISNLILPFFLI
jgi:hypothetical protein